MPMCTNETQRTSANCRKGLGLLALAALAGIGLALPYAAPANAAVIVVGHHHHHWHHHHDAIVVHH